jgi:nucleotide-binding universal stress UspA family protein
MEPIKKILVTLDVSEMNRELLQHASFIVDNSNATRIYFINVIKELNLPHEVKEEFPELEKRALRERRSQIKREIAAYFTPAREIESKVFIKQGQPTRSILNFATKTGVDLIVVGRKINLKGTGMLAQRLARRASCNLLIVPEGSTPRIERMLVPIDFSDYSKLALEEAIFFASRSKTPVEITCQNVYSIPVGYHYTGKSYEEFSAIMKRNAAADFEKFMSEIDTKGVSIHPQYSLDDNDNLVSDIYDMADKIDASVIIIGAKGRTAAAALFLGSFAEKMIQAELKYPLLVARPKGKIAGLMDLIKGL